MMHPSAALNRCADSFPFAPRPLVVLLIITLGNEASASVHPKWTTRHPHLATIVRRDGWRDWESIVLHFLTCMLIAADAQAPFSALRSDHSNSSRHRR
jgi:hypothetical protein